MESWLKAIATTLQGIHVRRSKYKITMGGGSICDLVRLQSVPLLRNVSLDNYKYCYFGEIRETLEYFCCFDLRDHLSSLVQHSKHTLKTLIIRNSPEHKEDMQLFWEMKQLRHLRIINPVDEDVLFQLQSMRRLMSLDVHCYLPPKKQNQILHILNDDCLIKIFSYLKLKDWVALTRTNSRFNNVVCQYVYPRQVIRLNEIDLKESERSGVLQQIGAYCKFLHLGAREIHLLKHFTKLEVLNVEHRKFHETEQKSIPNGLRKLSLEFDEWEDDFEYEDNPSVTYSFKDLFRRLNLTLTILHMSDDMDKLKCLKYLNHVRELTILNYSGRSIRTFLEKNKNHLERLELQFGSSRKKEFLELCALPKLKILELNDLNRKVNLFPAAYPSLEQINISFDSKLSPESRNTILNGISRFTNLNKLRIVPGVGYGSCMSDWKWLYPLKNLVKLTVFIQEEELQSILIQLPKLETIEWWHGSMTFECEDSLRKFLKEENRTVNFEHDGGILTFAP